MLANTLVTTGINDNFLHNMQADSLLYFDSMVDPDEYLYADGVHGAH